MGQNLLLGQNSCRDWTFWGSWITFCVIFPPQKTQQQQQQRWQQVTSNCISISSPSTHFSIQMRPTRIPDWKNGWAYQLEISIEVVFIGLLSLVSWLYHEKGQVVEQHLRAVWLGPFGPSPLCLDFYLENYMNSSLNNCCKRKKTPKIGCLDSSRLVCPHFRQKLGPGPQLYTSINCT